MWNFRKERVWSVLDLWRGFQILKKVANLFKIEKFTNWSTFFSEKSNVPPTRSCINKNFKAYDYFPKTSINSWLIVRLSLLYCRTTTSVSRSSSRSSLPRTTDIVTRTIPANDCTRPTRSASNRYVWKDKRILVSSGRTWFSKWMRKNVRNLISFDT